MPLTNIWTTVNSTSWLTRNNFSEADLRTGKAAWGVLLYLLGREAPGFSLPWSWPHRRFCAPLRRFPHPAYCRKGKFSHCSRECRHGQIQDLWRHELSSDEGRLHFLLQIYNPDFLCFFLQVLQSNPLYCHILLPPPLYNPILPSILPDDLHFVFVFCSTPLDTLRSPHPAYILYCKIGRCLFQIF